MSFSEKQFSHVENEIKKNNGKKKSISNTTLRKHVVSRILFNSPFLLILISISSENEFLKPGMGF